MPRKNQPIDFKATVRTHVGCVRSTNEDGYAINPALNLFAVADGMGGYERGDTASRIICDALTAIPQSNTFSELIDMIDDTVQQAHRDILTFSEEECDGRTIGSTLVSLVANNQSAACLWAGDSRLYRLREKQLTQLSKDHSQVAELVRLGHLTEAEAENHPNANLITRAVGTRHGAELELMLLEILPGDQYVLCSDGLYNEIRHPEIQAILTGHTPDDAADQLLALCLERGARDNVTFMLINADKHRG